jgi:hypothetical protein
MFSHGDPLRAFSDGSYRTRKGKVFVHPDGGEFGGRIEMEITMFLIVQRLDAIVIDIGGGGHAIDRSDDDAKSVFSEHHPRSGLLPEI